MTEPVAADTQPDPVLARDEYERRLVAHWMVTPHGCIMTDMSWPEMLQYATDLNETLGAILGSLGRAGTGDDGQ